MLKKLVLFSIFSIFFLACSEKEVKKIPPFKVKVYETKAEEVPLFAEFVGQVYGLKDIAIRARVEGFLESQYFREGFMVNKGAPLYRIEARKYKADAAAMMSGVAEARTSLVKAKSDLDRIKPLAEMNAVSQSDLDAAVATYEAAQAGVEAAQANLNASNIQLSYTNVSSPITGIIGKTQAKVGDFVGKDPNPVILNTVSRIDTILVEFFLTEDQYMDLIKHVNIDTLSHRDLENIEPNLELILSDGTVHPYKGLIKFIDREIDPSTGAILVQSFFPNPEMHVRPGQFAKIRSMVGKKKNGILIPQRCVMDLQGQKNVYVIGTGNKVELRRIELAGDVSDFFLVENGLEPGENVVYEGLQKVRPDAIVEPIPTDVTPMNQKGK
jgi:membrane fusion protein, multidrug efflux system